MKKILVPDMHCEMCVSRIEKAFSAAKLPYTASIAEHSVTVEENRLAEALESLEDLGFTPTAQ